MDLIQSLLSQKPSLATPPTPQNLDALSTKLIERSVIINERAQENIARLRTYNKEKAEKRQRHIVNSVAEAQQVEEEDILLEAAEVVKKTRKASASSKTSTSSRSKKQSAELENTEVEE